jgi:transaldolase
MEMSTSKLDQLRAMTTIVADTGDLEAVKRLKPVDCTTNPSIVLKALRTDAFRDVISEAVHWGRRQNGSAAQIAAATADRLAISVGVELLHLVPGYVSTEVDASLSFNVAASVARANKIVADYAERGIDRERVLIKLASTWEGIGAAAMLQKAGVNCNMTLLLNKVQAAASAEAGAFLISPFVGRIFDWYKKTAGSDFVAQDDPGVRSVREIYRYYKSRGITTIVMGASFRNIGQIEALAGCDRLTIAPALLEQLSADDGKLERALEPGDGRSGQDATLGHSSAAGGANVDDGDIRPLDEATFRWRMNEDPMATEKLAEGIRMFARDLQSLRETVTERLRE